MKWGTSHSPEPTKPRCSQKPSQWATRPRCCLRNSLSPFAVGRTTGLSQAHTPSSPPIYSQKAALQQLFSCKRNIGGVFKVFCLPVQCSSWEPGTEPEQGVYAVLLHFTSFSTGFGNGTPTSAVLPSWCAGRCPAQQLPSSPLGSARDLFKQD